MDKDPQAGPRRHDRAPLRHATTGKAVTFCLGCGRPGPGLHPHAGRLLRRQRLRGREAAGAFALPTSDAGHAPEFWTARFVKERDAGKTHLRIFWAWHGADRWQVADNPRLAFAGEPLLYKLYVIRELSQPDEPLEGDACVEFMQELLARLWQTDACSL